MIVNKEPALSSASVPLALLISFWLLTHKATRKSQWREATSLKQTTLLLWSYPALQINLLFVKLSKDPKSPLWD